MDHGPMCKAEDYGFLEDNTGETLDDLGCVGDLLAVIPMARSRKERINKLDFIKVKNVCSLRAPVVLTRRQATDWEKNICRRCI